MSMQSPNPNVTLAVPKPRPRRWAWSFVVALMLVLEAAFFIWMAYYFSYLRDCWRVMRTMEIDALRVAPWQSLSLMIPVWLLLGILVYNLAVVVILRLQRLERQYLLLLNARGDRGGD